MPVLSLVLGFVFAFVSAFIILVPMDKEWKYKADRFLILGVPLLAFLLGFGFVQVAAYNSSVRDVYNLQNVSKANLMSNAKMTKQALERALVKTDYKTLIADLANQGQSSKNMESLNGLYHDLTYYNIKAAQYLYAKEHPLLFWLDEGPCPDLGNLKLLTLEDLGF